MPASLERDPETGQFLPRKENDVPMEQVMRDLERDKAAKPKPEPEAKAEAEKEEDPNRDPQTEAEPEEQPESKAEERFPADKEKEPKEADGDKDPAEADAEKAKGFFEEFLDPKGKKKEEKAKDAKKPDAKAKPAAQPAKKVPPVAPRAEALTAKDIAAATAEAVANVLRPKGEAQEKEAGPELPPKELRTYNTLARMEKLFPENTSYKDIGERYKKGLLALEKYAADWESSHPGETFDQEAEEHKAFLQKNNVDWEDEDFVEAVADIRADAKMEKANADSNKRMSKLERAEKLRDEAPKVAESQNRAARQIWTEFGEEFEDVVTEAGQFDAKKIEELSKTDPVGFGYRWAAAVDLNREAAEVHKLYQGLVDFDSKNPVHLEMDGFISGMEKRLSAKPAEEKTDAEGRLFATQEQWNALTPTQRENRWTLSSHDVIYHRARFLARETTEKITQEEEKLRRHAEAKGWKAPEGKANQSPKAKKPADEEPEEGDDTDNEKPQGPGSMPASKLAALRDRASADRANSQNSFVSDI